MRISISELPQKQYTMEEGMEQVWVEKDLGVNLTLEKHISEKVNQANKVGELIHKTFVSLDEVYSPCQTYN